MSKTSDRMLEKKRQPFPVSISQKFYNNIERYDTIIIVEGSSDENFYKNTNIKILNNAFYIFANQDANILGKKAVIEAYFRIREWSRGRNTYNHSVIFIVDKDFFGINWRAYAYKEFEKTYKAQFEDINNFTILDCHSHECYFILENNLKQIFKLLNMEDKLGLFNHILEENLDDFSEYFAYKSILVDENPNYIERCRVNSWISFDFKFQYGNIIFNKPALLRDVENMKEQINKNSNKDVLKKQYAEMKQKFKNDPKLLRGHTVYDFLECYLKHYGKSLKDNGKYNYEIIKAMEIPLNIKVLKFDRGKYKLE